MLELVLIVLVVLWFVGGLAIPTSAALLNVLVAVIIIYLLLKIGQRV